MSVFAQWQMLAHCLVLEFNRIGAPSGHPDNGKQVVNNGMRKRTSQQAKTGHAERRTETSCSESLASHKRNTSLGLALAAAQCRSLASAAIPPAPAVLLIPASLHF